MNRAIAGFVVYDVTDYYSFQNIGSWLEEINSHANDEMIIALVGNKADQNGIDILLNTNPNYFLERRKVSSEEAKKFADANGLLFFETSAKKGTQVDDVWNESLSIFNNLRLFIMYPLKF